MTSKRPLKKHQKQKKGWPLSVMASDVIFTACSEDQRSPGQERHEQHFPWTLWPAEKKVLIGRGVWGEVRKKDSSFPPPGSRSSASNWLLPAAFSTTIASPIYVPFGQQTASIAFAKLNRPWTFGSINGAWLPAPNLWKSHHRLNQVFFFPPVLWACDYCCVTRPGFDVFWMSMGHTWRYICYHALCLCMDTMSFSPCLSACLIYSWTTTSKIEVCIFFGPDRILISEALEMVHSTVLHCM